jgi:hypothetical protein
LSINKLFILKLLFPKNRIFILKIQYFPSQIDVNLIYFFSPENSNISENNITSDEAPKVENFL